MILAKNLCDYALHAVGGGYCFGASGEVSTPARRAMWAEWNPAQAANLLNTCKKWDGEPVWDCSGLFRGAWRALASSKSGGATTIFSTWCAEKGPIETMPDQAGIALFRGDDRVKEHIGLYVGGGMVVDARGSSQGVLHGTIASYKAGWTHWGRLKDVQYEPKEATDMSEILYSATIKTRTGRGVGLWPQALATGKELAHVPEGGTVLILREVGGWCEALFAGVQGYVDGQYLVYEPSETDQSPPQTDPGPKKIEFISVPMFPELYDALNRAMADAVQAKRAAKAKKVAKKV